jgi:hypothetical protein
MMVINSRGIGEETVTMETQRHTSQRKSVSQVNVDDIEVLSGDGSVCVEIKGQPMSGQSSILLEKWTIQILTNEDNCAGHIISSKYLNSAVRSFLYFSQINSWVVSYKGHLPFTLIYRYIIYGNMVSVYMAIDGCIYGNMVSVYMVIW